MNTLTQAGIAAYKAGDKTKARSLFEQATQENPQNIQAWLGLAATAPTLETRLDYFVHVLHLDASNPTAMKGLARMVAKDEAVVKVKERAAPPNEHSSSERHSDERVVFQVRPSKILLGLRALTPLALTGLLAVYGITGENMWGGLFLFLACILFIATFGVILYTFVLFNATQYTLTNKHLIVQNGLFNRSRKTIPIHRIQDVVFHQSWQERLFGLGHVVVESAGEYGSVKLREMADSQRRADQILKVMNR